EAKTPARGAARLLGLATKKAAKEEKQRIGGFYAPSSLEFDDANLAARYADAFDKLVDIELAKEMRDKIPPQESAAMDEQRDALLKELSKVRQIGKPRRKTAAIVKVAEAIDKPTVEQARREIEAKATKPIELDDAIDADIDYMPPERVSELEGDELVDTFARVARWAA